MIGAHKKDREFVAAETCCIVRCANAFAQESTNLTQHCVASAVAVAVVDGLEVVEVDIGEKARFLIARGAQEIAAKYFIEAASVEQPREFVGLCEGLKLLDALVECNDAAFGFVCEGDCLRDEVAIGLRATSEAEATAKTLPSADRKA